jgi:hypothetical protein
MAQIVLRFNSSMSRFLKSLIVSLISFVLLYYSAAWAVLKCLHDDDDANSAVALFDTDVRGSDYYLLSPSAVESHLLPDLRRRLSFTAGRPISAPT